MARLIFLNGSPGIGKSTVARIYADRHPGTLHLDVDTLHYFVGGWKDEETNTWPDVWALVRAMATTHLERGNDVVLPAYQATVEEISAWERLAGRCGAEYRAVVLLDDRASAVERFNRRARDSDDEWTVYHHRLIQLRGGDAVLGGMYDQLVEVIRLRPNTVVVHSSLGDIEQTYQALVEALHEREAL